MRISFKVLGIVAVVAVFISGCSGNNSGSVAGSGSSAAAVPDQVYTISQVSSLGIDASGLMWIKLQGSFGASDNTVSMTCDGNVLSVAVESQSSTQVVAAVPAASYYAACAIEVQSGGAISNSFGTGLTAMAMSGTSHEVLNSNTSFVDLELDGYFITTTSAASSISIGANCGGMTFTPQIISVGDSAIVIELPNPGTGKSENCLFTANYTFEDQEHNTEIVSSMALTAIVNGL